MSQSEPVCPVNDITTSGQTYNVRLHGRIQEIFLFTRNQHIYAYINSCPHTGATLNWQPDQFFNFENTLIQCSIHGALFRPEDGYCIQGPCRGESLSRLGVEVLDEMVYVNSATSSFY